MLCSRRARARRVVFLRRLVRAGIDESLSSLQLSDGTVLAVEVPTPSCLQEGGASVDTILTMASSLIFNGRFLSDRKSRVGSISSTRIM